MYTSLTAQGVTLLHLVRMVYRESCTLSIRPLSYIFQVSDLR